MPLLVAIKYNQHNVYDYVYVYWWLVELKSIVQLCVSNVAFMKGSL